MRGWRRSVWLTCIAVVVTAACARQAASTGQNNGRSDALLADEIRRSGANDALSAIRMLRPRFLATRGRTTILGSEESEPVVYVDERPIGNVSTLRDIPANSIVEVRHFDAAQAQMRFGAGHSQGAILIITGSRRPGSKS